MKDILFTKDFFENTYISLIVADRNRTIIQVNNSTLSMTGYDKNELIGKNLDILAVRKFNKNSFRDFQKTMKDDKFWEGEVWNRRKNGEPFLTKRTVFENKNIETGESEFILLSIDITDEKLKEKKFNELLYKDIITGLPNKHVYREITENLLRKKKKSNGKLPIVFLDISRFNKINESFGYVIGDELLKEVATRLQHLIGESNNITRLGGDLFSFSLIEISNHERVVRELDKICTDFKTKPFVINEQEIFLTVNMGVSLFPSDADNIEELFRKADFALSRAREDGTNVYQFYTNDLNVRAFEQLVMETNLRRAIERDELTLHFQPQVDIKTNKVVSLESLVRWNHPELGLVPPGKFIPLAEETGLISSIGDWVLKEACRQNKEWQDRGFKPVVVAVNLSPQQFHRQNVVKNVQEVLEETGLEAKYLELEITESAIMKDINKTIETLDMLKDIGVKISIDDFGTGYSSLNHLAKFPLHSLKIDRSFIQYVDSKKENKAITSTIIDLAHGLNLEIVAEGVETVRQLHFLKKRNCEKYQGFYFSPPLPSGDVEKFLQPNKK